MDSLTLFKQTNFSTSTWWKLNVNIKGFQNAIGLDLITEIQVNRFFRLVEINLNQVDWENKSRVLVQLFEDGYLCWIDIENLICKEIDVFKESNVLRDSIFIENALPSILKWIKDQSEKPNYYLWGGTIGPNFDCSGLIQAAFWKHDIYLPRDAYQMQKFSQVISTLPLDISKLKMGDLLFFGNDFKCNHVGIYFMDGLYFHSSGRDHGRNGIGLDSLVDLNNNVSSYYQSRLKTAGRVIRSYQWNKTIR